MSVFRKLVFFSALLTVLSVGLFPALPARAETVYNVNWRGVAIKGYDPVAYFTQGRPVKGESAHELQWEGAMWRFSGKENLERVRAEPQRYAPRYGGYCAYGVAVGGLYDIEPEAWSIVDGVLYLNKNLRTREIWRKDIPGYIEKADRNWPGLKGK